MTKCGFRVLCFRSAYYRPSLVTWLCNKHKKELDQLVIKFNRNFMAKRTSHQENVDGSVSLVIEGSDHIQYPHIVEPWQ